MKITPDYDVQPTPNHTMTAAVLHGVVDGASLTSFTADDFSDSAGDLYTGSEYSASTAYVKSSTAEVFAQPQSEVSVENMRVALGRTDLAYFADSYGYAPVRGMPCFVPSHGDHSRGSWSGWSSYSLTDHWFVPRVSMDQVLFGTFHSWNNITTTVYEDSVQWDKIYGVVDETLSGANGLVKMLSYAYGTAMVHASLSNEISLPGTIYCLQYDFTDNTLMPVARNFTDVSQFTAEAIPLGLVRKVFTESGVTNIPFAFGNESSATNVPYYVAEVFFGGFPCL